jgi:hypothetical protein
MRRVSFYNTDPDTIGRLCEHLRAVGLPYRSRLMTASAGYYGRRQVTELALSSSQPTYTRFASEIGSSISRKQTTLDAIAVSYVADMAAVRREMQAKVFSQGRRAISTAASSQ